MTSPPTRNARVTAGDEERETRCGAHPLEKLTPVRSQIPDLDPQNSGISAMKRGESRGGVSRHPHTPTNGAPALPLALSDQLTLVWSSEDW
jgi:hypothetical protein